MASLSLLRVGHHYTEVANAQVCRESFPVNRCVFAVAEHCLGHVIRTRYKRGDGITDGSLPFGQETCQSCSICSKIVSKKDDGAFFSRWNLKKNRTNEEWLIFVRLLY